MTGDASTALQFLQALYPEGVSPNHLLIWAVTGNAKRSHWFTSIEQAAQFATIANADAVYFGLSTSAKDHGPHARCKADEVAALPGLVCDLDIASPAHSKPGLPPSKEEAGRILPAEFPPTITVDSGFGVYGFWLFREPWIFDSAEERQRAAALSQRWHSLLARNAERFGFAIDSVYDLSRVIRLVGTLNKKVDGDHREVRILANGGPRYNPSDLEEILNVIGVPEIEVRAVDEAGRIEFGALHVNPGVELTSELKQRLDALFEIDPDSAAVWTRRKRMPKDGTWSGYAQSIANRLALTGFSDQQIIDLLTIHRRKFGDPGKTWPKPLSWFTTTIGKARSWAAEQERIETARQQREQRREAAEREERDERQAIAEVTLSPDKATERLHHILELDVTRLVQVGNNEDPSYRLELKDGRSVVIPSLTAMSSFAGFDRHIWRYLGTPLPPRAKKMWRQVRAALGQLIVIEDLGMSDVEVLLSDLGEYFSNCTAELFKTFPAADYPEGPPPETNRHRLCWMGLVRATTEDEYIVALKLLALPRKDPCALVGVYWQSDDAEDGLGRVAFKLPPLYEWLQRKASRKFEAGELSKRLAAAGFRFRDTGVEHGVRLRRVWRGELNDGAVEDQFMATRVAEYA